MSDAFLSEIRIMSFNYAPRGWALCSGQLLPINQNQALFSLLGTTYGGDGRVNFGLPNLQGNVPIHAGNGFNLGDKGGEQGHTLTPAEMPSHVHPLQATTDNASVADAAGNLLATTANVYTPAANLTALHPASVSPIGGSQAHNNMQPYLTLNFSIALAGLFPSQN